MAFSALQRYAAKVAFCTSLRKKTPALGFWLHKGLRWGFLASVFASLGVSCQKEVRVEPSLPPFALEEKDCLRFLDRRTGLHFCLPQGTQMQLTGGNVEEDALAFEIRLTLGALGAEIFVRKDPLPAELPPGALSGPWLRRYAEAYARQRGASSQKARLLGDERLAFFRAESAAWLAFPFRDTRGDSWEEALVLARSPATRILISWRLLQNKRGSHEAQRIADTLHLFLSSLRLEGAR